MPTIVFVCTANQYRSPIAEACFKKETLKHKQEDEWTVLSAGTWTTDGLPGIPEAIDRARQLGVDIQAHRSQVITADMLQRADLVLVMEQGQKEALHIEFPDYKEKILMLSEAAKGIPYDIPDPVKAPNVGDVAVEIRDLIRNHYKNIVRMVER